MMICSTVNLDLLCTAAGVTLHRIDAGMKLEAKHIMMETTIAKTFTSGFAGQQASRKAPHPDYKVRVSGESLPL